MSIILAVDPGIRGVGAALFVNSWLEEADYIFNSSERGNGPLECATMAKAVKRVCDGWGVTGVDRLVLEWPQVYDDAHSKGDKNDLLPLAGIDAALVMAFMTNPLFEVTYYIPKAWKGTAPKAVMGQRILSRLTPTELALIPSGHLAHNVIDAVGIGLYYLGKLEPKRVYAK